MTLHDESVSGPQANLQSRLGQMVSASAWTTSRRDAMRMGAMIAGSALLPGTVRASADDQSQASIYAAAQADEPQSDIELVIPLDPYGESISLDPHRAVDWGPLWVTLPYVWSGLLAFDQNGAVIPDLAKEVVPGEDASIWTATLRDDLTFASGARITAQNFVDSWKRALDPANVAPMATFMEPVEGYGEYIAGTSTDIGFEAKDERTIEIRLTEPLSYFPSYLATFVWAVIDLEVLAESPSDFTLQDAAAGQWRFTEFLDNDHMTMEPNSSYWNGNSPSVAKITWPFMDSIAAATDGLEQYRNDEIASLDVPASLAGTVSEDAVLSPDLTSIASTGSTIAIGFDFRQPPFNDIRMRQAIAASVDTNAWANDIWQGAYSPATSFTPPSTVEISGYSPPAAPSFDAARAKDLVSQAGFETGEAQTEIIYYQAASDSPESQEHHAALLKMISDNSGVTVTADTSKTADQIIALQTDVGGRQFDIVWWWPVTDTPSLLSTVGRSTSQFMAGWFNWSPDVAKVGDIDPGGASAEFDRITTEADQELDAETRNGKYLEAEKILLDNAVYVPLGHWVQSYIQKAWLQGTRQGPWSGRIPVRIDKDVIVSGKPG